MSENPVLPRRQSTSGSVAHGAAEMTRRMVCGGLAGMIAKTATNPLERIKMLSQTGEHGSAGRQSPLCLYRSILKNEGVRGLWAGNGANLLRVFPAKAVVFSANDFYRNQIRGVFKIPESQPLPGYFSFLAGGLSGMSATLLTYPLDLARGRISGKLAGANHQRHYSGIINTVVLTVKEEGFTALYKGVTPTILGAMPYEGIKFGTVGLLESIFPVTTTYNEQGEKEKPSVWRKVCYGGAGGVMAGIITYPNDTVRRMLQLQGSRGTTAVYTGYWDCVKKIYARHGIQRFYYGITINIIRMAPNAAFQFGSYELLKNLSDDLM